MRLIDADALLAKMNMAIVMLKRTMKNFDIEDDPECQMELKAYQDIRDGIKDEPTIEPMRWIPCSERLPEVGRSVLISVVGMYTAEGCLRDDGDWAQFRWKGIQKKDMVDAWMPLPEPYSERREE